MRNNDKVGFIAFTDKIEKYIPPRKGSRHIMRIIREMLYTEPVGRGTDIPFVLEYLGKITNQSTITFLVSDFCVEDIKKPMSIANKKHDIVAVRITDPRDFDLPDVGVIKLDDPEKHTSHLIDTGQESIRREYRERSIAKEIEMKNVFYSVNVESNKD